MSSLPQQTGESLPLRAERGEHPAHDLHLLGDPARHVLSEPIAWTTVERQCSCGITFECGFQLQRDGRYALVPEACPVHQAEAACREEIDRVLAVLAQVRKRYGVRVNHE